MRFSGPILQTQEVERFGKNTLIYSGYKPSACEDSYTTSSHAFLFFELHNISFKESVKVHQ